MFRNVITKYRSSLRNIQEERRRRLRRDGCLKSRKNLLPVLDVGSAIPRPFGPYHIQHSGCSVRPLYSVSLDVLLSVFMCLPDCRPVILTYLLTYLFTPWSRVLLEKLTGLQLVKKFPAFYETRRFITAFTSFRHLSLS